MDEEEPEAASRKQLLLEADEEEQKTEWEPYASRILSDPTSKAYLDYKRNKIKRDKLQLLMHNVQNVDIVTSTF